MIPETHIDIFENPVMGILSTISLGDLVYSRLCRVSLRDNLVSLESIDDQQLEQLADSDKVSVLVVDPVNVDRWLYIQGIASRVDTANSSCSISIKKVIAFPG